MRCDRFIFVDDLFQRFVSLVFFEVVASLMADVLRGGPVAPSSLSWDIFSLLHLNRDRVLVFVLPLSILRESAIVLMEVFCQGRDDEEVKKSGP